MPSFSFWVFAVLDFTLKKLQCFFDSGPNWAHFGGFRANNSSKHCQIELKFWPQVVLIVVQMPFKGFWKARIFTENFYCTQSLSFWSDFDPNLPTEHGQKHKNRHRTIQISQNQGPTSFQFSMKTIITFCCIWVFFGYWWAHFERSRGHTLC